MAEKLGVMLCGHGSRNRKAVTEFANLSEHLKKRLPDYPVEFGYLEFATPIIREGLDKLRAEGCTRILAAPGMLFAAGHAKNDIPSVLNAYAALNNVRIDYGKELGIDPKMMRAAADRIQEAIDAAPRHVDKHDTLLGAAHPTLMPIPMWQRSCAFCGKALVSAGAKWLIRVSRFRLWNRLWNISRALASSASSCFPISYSLACWCSASIWQLMWCRKNIPALNFSKHPI
jgi:CbiX